MSTFFTTLGDIFTLLNSFKVLGDLSVMHILVSGVVGMVLIKFLKGRK